MKAEAKQVVIDFLTAVQVHKREKAASLLHPAIEWHQPGNNALSGIKKNLDEVIQMGMDMGSIAEQSIELSEIKVLAENGGTIACLLHWMANPPSGKVFEVDNIDVYEVADGKIVRAKVYSADIAKEDRFWKK